MNAMDQDASPQSDRSGENLLLLFMRSLAVSVAIFLRRDFGAEYLGIPAALVIIIIPLFAGAYLRHDPMPLWYFLGFYLILCCVARLTALRRWIRGERYHSYYSGTSWMQTLFPSFSTTVVRCVLEPSLVLLVAAGFMPSSESLGTYLLYVGLALGVTEGMAHFHSRREVARMHDAYMEQMNLADRFGGLRN